MNMKSEVVSQINIQCCALKFLTLLDKSDKFSLAKLVDKVMSSTRLVFKKNCSQALSDPLRSRILEIVANLVMEQYVHKWDTFTKYAGDRTIFGAYEAEICVIHFVNFF